MNRHNYITQYIQFTSFCYHVRRCCVSSSQSACVIRYPYTQFSLHSELPQHCRHVEWFVCIIRCHVESSWKHWGKKLKLLRELYWIFRFEITLKYDVCTHIEQNNTSIQLLAPCVNRFDLARLSTMLTSFAFLNETSLLTIVTVLPLAIIDTICWAG